MAVELVIKIPKEMYEWINDANKFYKDYGISDFVGFIKNGILLPKGHGNLIDADALLEKQYRIDDSATLSTRDVVNVEDVEDAPTIIEADIPTMYYPQVEGVTPTVVDAGKQEPFDEYGNYKYPSDVELTEPNTATSMPCDDAISRQAVLDLIADYDLSMGQVVNCIHSLPSVNPQPKTGHCKDCKWWKDSDGTYRRGFRAESKCPINRKEVYEGNGYCFLFDPQESEG